MAYDQEFIEKWVRLSPAIQQYYLDVQDGKRSISFYNDVVFKKLLDPDTQKQRLSRLLSLIVGRKVEVLHSIRNEGTLTSVFSKKRILDISAILDQGEYVDLEMQVLAENYAGERAVVYSCDLVGRQYSINEQEKKSDMDFGKVRPVYSITLMKESPPPFVNTQEYIHKFTQTSATGVALNLLQEYYFIELDKYVDQNAGNVPHTLLGAWIAFVGTDSLKTRLNIIEKYPEFEEINKELIEMSFNRKELITMTEHNLEIMERNTLYNTGKSVGFQEGIQTVANQLRMHGMTVEQIEEILGQELYAKTCKQSNPHLQS